jgi:hypothetical protein
MLAEVASLFATISVGRSILKRKHYDYFRAEKQKGEHIAYSKAQPSFVRYLRTLRIILISTC